MTAAERRFGLNRYAMASQTVFMSHETYTPARGGSASAEVIALRNTFGEAASDIVVANTKGFTGHPMGVGVEDVIAVKILEYGIVPPVPNFKEVDPDLGVLNLSRGGRYPVQYALHLAAGFGSQIAMTLIRRIPGGLDRVDDKLRYQHWLADVSGYDRAELEVVKRILRVSRWAAPAAPRPPARGATALGPSVRAAAPGDGNAAAAYHPQPMPAVRELLGKPAADTVTSWQGDTVTGERSAVPAPAALAPKPAPVVETLRPALRRRLPQHRNYEPVRHTGCAAAAVHDARQSPAPAVPPSSSQSPSHPVIRHRRQPGAGHRGRQDRLPAGHARPRPGPGGRPGHRHGQAGRDLPGRARGLRHPAAGRAEPARLPDAGERDRVRAYHAAGSGR